MSIKNIYFVVLDMTCNNIMSPQLEVRFVFFGAFLEHLVHLDNDKNSAIDDELGNEVKQLE
jgi:hypothetical protein